MNLPFLAVSDRVAMVTPIGLFFGRLSNFIVVSFMAV